MTNQLFSWRWLNLHRLIVAIVFIAIFTMAIRFPVDHDTWWHLRSGQTMVETKRLLVTDPFSYTKTNQLWINHGWLAQLFWYGMLAIGSWPLVAVGLAAIVSLAFWLVWQQSSGNIYLKAFLTILGTIASSIIWAARPQMISFLLTAVVSFLLYRFKYKGGRLMPWLPLLMLLWVNVHGGFAIAFILMICYAVGELFNRLTQKEAADGHLLDGSAWRHLLIAFIISLAVVGINPHTWRMWLYPFQTVGIGVLRDFIAEWQSPNFHQPIIYPFLAMLLLLFTALARTSRRVDWVDLALIGAWTTLSLFAVRNVPIFALVCTPILTKYLDSALVEHLGQPTIGRVRPLPKLGYVVNWTLLGLVGLAAAAQILITLSPQSILNAEKQKFPYEAITFIREQAPTSGPIFNSYNFGGYLIYHLWPDYPVFVDGRTDLYDDEFLRSYLQTSLALPGWQTFLDEQGIQLIIIEEGSSLDMALAQDTHWDKLFSDDQAVIYGRKS